MKKILLILLVCLCAGNASAQWNKSVVDNGVVSNDTIYIQTLAFQNYLNDGDTALCHVYGYMASDSEEFAYCIFDSGANTFRISSVLRNYYGTQDAVSFPSDTGVAYVTVQYWYNYYDLLVGDTGIGTGTVTSVNVSGGTTGLSFTGGPITTFGTITAGGILDTTHGGTSANTAYGALLNLLPPRISHANEFLSNDGTDVFWSGVTSNNFPPFPNDTTLFLRGDSTWAHVTGSGSGVSIGDPIGSSLSLSVLYIDGSGNLAQDNPNFIYQGSGILTLGSNSSTGILALVGSGSSDNIALQADVNTTPYSLIFPPTAGSPDYVLATDGGGTLSWVPNGSSSDTLSIGDTVANSANNQILRTNASHHLDQISNGSNDYVLFSNGGGSSPTFQNPNHSLVVLQPTLTQLIAGITSGVVPLQLKGTGTIAAENIFDVMKQNGDSVFNIDSGKFVNLYHNSLNFNTADQGIGLYNGSFLDYGRVGDALFSTGYGSTPVWLNFDSLIALSSGGLINWIDSVNTASPNDVIPANALVVKSDSVNADAVIQAKGTGSFLLQIPNSASSGGAKRGQNSVDLQLIRTSQFNVASGIQSFLAGGEDNLVSGYVSAIVGGLYNIADDNFQFIGGGQSNYIHGVRSAIIGGYLDSAIGDYSVISGGSTNRVSSGSSFIAGGSGSKIEGTHSVILASNGMTLSNKGNFGFLSNLTTGDNVMTISTDNIATFGNVDLWLANNDTAARSLLFFAPNSATGLFDTSTTLYTGFHAGAQTTSVNYQLPLADGANGSILGTDGAGTLSWISAGGGSGIGSVTSVSGGTTGLTFSNPTTTPTMTGALIVANGGTGQTTLGNHELLLGNGTSGVTSVSATATNDQILWAHTAGAAPAFTSTPTLGVPGTGGSIRLAGINSGYFTIQPDTLTSWTWTPPNTGGSANQFLRTDGSGKTTWATVTSGSGTVTSVALSGTNGIAILSGSPITTSGTIALGITNGSIADTSLASNSVTNAKILNGTINLTTKVTGVLPEANGGTNQSTYTTGDILYASAANTLSKLTIGASGTRLIVSGGIPAWSASPIPVAQGGSGWTQVAVSGSDFLSSGTALQDITGMSFTATASTNYFVDIWLDVVKSTSTGFQFALKSTGTSPLIKLRCDGETTSTTPVTTIITGSDNPNGTWGTSGQETYVHIAGWVHSGTGSPVITVRVNAPTSGTVTVRNGSFMNYRAFP